MSGRKAPGELGIQMTESKISATPSESGTMSGPLVASVRMDHRSSDFRRKADVVHVLLRLFCLLTSLVALSMMVTAKQFATIDIYGIHFPVYSRWSFSDSFEYLVGISSAVAAHSVLQLLINVTRLVRKSPLIPSRNHAWLIFAGDQVFAYAMVGAGSSASAVTNLNRTGIRHTDLPNFCKPLRSFCDRVAISIAFAFLTCLFLAISAVLEVVWLSKY